MIKEQLQWKDAGGLAKEKWRLEHGNVRLTVSIVFNQWVIDLERSAGSLGWLSVDREIRSMEMSRKEALDRAISMLHSEAKRLQEAYELMADSDDPEVE